VTGDPLSAALGSGHARCDVARGFVAGGGPWALRFRARPALRLPVAVRGACWIILDGQEPLRLHEGELAAPDGTVPFVLASDPSVPPRDADELFADESAPIVRLGGSSIPLGDSRELPRGTTVSTGSIAGVPSPTAVPGGAADSLSGAVVAGITRRVRRRPGELILDRFPAVTRIRAAEPFERVLKELAHPEPGSEFAGEQYAQLVLLDMLRAADVPATGSLRLYADAELRPALVLMQERPAYPWRLTDLAKAVSMSRSAFAARFRDVCGEPPLTYLQRRRIGLARTALRDTDATLAELAPTLGYGSATAFSHAFTRAAGRSPARYRQLVRRP
jgi:AraC-like DNA-binding protein